MQRLERGENLNDEDGFGSTGDARDSISWLDRSVAVRVSNMMLTHTIYEYHY